ncbi:hypothetical protein Lfu02_57170 [Longispora fulva]|uniref:Uncharacterized protein n=1 Tax=Longispora fulva TaxID=619741 RepID=A0A8J7GIN7_9ACTN|nr:DUF6412 domain-containing protein [Longispora fulva]MBG6137300.1 hypothetical protein [Longispora fulva]GIG61345.1 hypothetical protein Lfu02_57170 [Longispora fulva]
MGTLVGVPRSVIPSLGLVLLAEALVGGHVGLAATVALTVAALCVALLASRFAVAPVAASALAGAGRHRARPVEFVRQGDPGTAGRPRPRAPSAA